MSVVDNTYFQREPLYIPETSSINVAEPGDAAVLENNVERFINIHEPELLIQALGITEYNAILDALTKTPFDPGAGSAADQKYIDLITGHTYTKDGIEYRFEGLRGREKNSFVAHYIYCMYLKNDQTKYTSIGTILPKAKNALPATRTSRFIKSWQEFMYMYQSADTDAPVIRETAWGIQWLDYHGSRNRLRSLYQYIVDMNNLAGFTDRYDGVEFGVVTMEESYNSFGI